jgi:hypothetical protein
MVHAAARGDPGRLSMVAGVAVAGMTWRLATVATLLVDLDYRQGVEDAVEHVEIN